MENLYSLASTFLARVVRNPEVARLISICNWEQIYQFEVDGKTPFHWCYYGGKLTIEQGATKENDFMIVTRVVANEETLRAIFLGKADSVDVQIKEEEITFRPSGKYTPVHFFHQLAKGNRKMVLEKVIADHDASR
jgi:hypothetical protein